MNNTNKNPFFIIGIGRSGTTLIRLMLNNHPNIAIPYESHFITDYVDKLEKYGDLSDDNNLKELVNDILNEELLQMWDHEFSLERIINSIKEPNLENIFNAIFMDYALAKGKIRWGDKSDYLVRIHIINKIFPQAKFIHIIRDGRDVANSVMKLPWGPNDIISAAEWWHNNIKLGRNMGAMLANDRYTEIRYEDLVLNTEEELKRLCKFIGEDFDESLLEYYKTSDKLIPKERKSQHYGAGSAPKSSRTYAWKKEMSNTNIAIFNSYAKESLIALNYETDTQKVNPLLVKLSKIMVYLKRLF